MKPVVSLNKETFLVSDYLDEVWMYTLPEGEYDLRDYDPEHSGLAFLAENYPRMETFEIVSKYYGYMSAPGYMDRSEYFIGDSRAEVAQQLLDYFYDGDDADPDEVAWLEAICK
jgi:hypothetical protein